MVADALSRKAVHTSAMITTQERLQDEMKRAGIDVMVKGGNVQMAQLTIQPTLRKKIIDAQRSDEHLSKVWSQTERGQQGILSPQTGVCYGKTACAFPETRES